MFEQSRGKQKIMTTESLRAFVHKRLTDIFPYVCDQQLELKNSKGAVLYHLFIICANRSRAAKELAETLAYGAMRRRRKPK